MPTSVRPTVVTTRRFLLSLMVLSLSTSACWGSSGGEPWVAPDPPDSWASGLSIEFIPGGFDFVWNEGHETVTFHVFQDGDGGQIAIGRELAPEPYSFRSEEVTQAGRRFGLNENNRTGILVWEELPSGVRVVVVSQSLDKDTLLRVAESVGYQATRDGQA